MTVAVTEINEQMLQKKKENTNENKTSIPVVVAQCSRCVPDSSMCVHVQPATSGPTDTCALCLHYIHYTERER